MKTKLLDSQKWHRLNWRELEKKVLRKQRNIVRAWSKGDNELVFKLQKDLMLSFAGRAVAVLKVSRGEGSSTPGVDQKKLGSPSEKWKAIAEIKYELDNINKYKADRVRRVWIPKQENEKRPLGIPTVRDRCLQSLVVLAVDPIAEYTADIHSYGFRKGRGTQNAMARVRHILDKRNSPRWILDADVAKCFDHISHEYLLKKSASFMCTIGVQLVKEWLTAEVIEVGKKPHRPKAGTPQGGVISPMLANIALDGLERCVRGKRLASRCIKKCSY